MKGLWRGMLVVLAVILGVCAGGVLAFYATYYAVVLFWPQAFVIGWIFCFLTVPLGAGIGGVVGARVTAWIVPRVSEAD